MVKELSERQKIKNLEESMSKMVGGIQAVERNLLMALNQLSFSLGTVVETLKEKGLITEEDLKAQGEKLNEMIQKRQAELQKKIVVPGQESKVVNILKQESLEKLGDDLKDDKPKDDKPSEKEEEGTSTETSPGAKPEQTKEDAAPVTTVPKEGAGPETAPKAEEKEE